MEKLKNPIDLSRQVMIRSTINVQDISRHLEWCTVLWWRSADQFFSSHAERFQLLFDDLQIVHGH